MTCVLVCPDKFAGTLTAAEAAQAVAEGWARTRPGDELRRLPLADGGPGFLDVLHIALGGRLVPCRVTGPLGRPVPASVLVVGDTGYLESAQACGLHLVTPGLRDPARTTTRGVGELINLAVAEGVRRIVVGLGGSGTNDGGRGALSALAAIPARDVQLLVATDVESPLLGPGGATYGFARQKGAALEDLPGLERDMAQWARRDRHLADAAGAGAAGGLAFGLMLAGARRVPGIDTVMQAVDFPTAVAWADVVVTGEGRFDWQSLQGKVVSGVLQRAAGIPVIVLAGQVEGTVAGVTAFSVADHVGGAAQAMADPAAGLRSLAAAVAAGSD